MPQGPARRRYVAVLAACVVFVATAAVAMSGNRQAHASEVYLPSDSATFTLSGHGFGHGKGLSQWGAYGMATEGQTAAQILDFYYPGTQTTTAATNAPVRVWLSQNTGTDVDVVAALGVESVTNSAGGAALSLPAAVGASPVTNWKSTRDAATGVTTLWGLWQGAWQAYPVAPAAQLSTTGTLTFASDRGLVRLVYPDGTERDYQGSIGGVADGAVLRTINTVPMEDYLKGVVPHEAVNTWPTAALEAQAIAARTYATSRLGAAVYDICDTTACQVYSGVASFDAQGNLTANLEFAQSNAAIAAVAGQIRTFGGQPISAQYSSSNGGWTVSGGGSWEPAQPDPFDHYAPDHDWSQTLSSAAIEAVYPAVGVLTNLVVNQRDGNGDWGGRVLSLTLNGSGGSLTLTGSAFQTAMALKSTWFTVGDGAGPASGGYLHPVVPARILDTRTAGNGPFTPGQTRAVQVAGLGGVPADAIGVVLNVTATDTTSSSYLTVWPQPNPQPNTSNLNWDKAGQTVANLVYTGLGPNGSVLIYNNLGRASVVVDVFGYYEPPTIAGGLGFLPVTPNRILDTRYAIGGPATPLGAGESRNVAVVGTNAIRSDAVAALFNLTATRPTATSYFTLWPTGVAQPGTSNLNTFPGETRANAALDLLGSSGEVSLYNNLGKSDAIIDVLGQYVPASGAGGEFVGLQPSRLLDTRTSIGGHPRPMGAAETFALPVLGRGGVPTSGVSAVVLNVTAVAPSGQTYVTAWPSGIARPGASNLNAAPHAVVPNLVVSGIGANGTVDLYNDVGSTGLVVDVVGWISS